MGIAFEHCRWCKGRPGGCLYCAEERAWQDQLAIYREMAIARERCVIDGLDQGILRLVRVIEIVENAEGQTVDFHSDGVQTLSRDPRKGQMRSTRGRQGQSAPAPFHKCQFLGVPGRIGQRQRCLCGREQEWRWLPSSLTRSGEWVDAPKVVSEPKRSQVTSAGPRRRKVSKQKQKA